MLHHHSERLPQSLADRLSMALRCACLSIFRRNIDWLYTNIFIISVYATLAAGQFMH